MVVWVSLVQALAAFDECWAVSVSARVVSSLACCTVLFVLGGAVCCSMIVATVSASVVVGNALLGDVSVMLAFGASHWFSSVLAWPEFGLVYCDSVSNCVVGGCGVC